MDVLNEPFPEGEAAIAKSSYYSFIYAKWILRKPFPLGEAAIATSAEYSCSYAIDVLKAPFRLGEAQIFKSKPKYNYYIKFFPIKKRPAFFKY